ncbi:LysR family transcriptional regulator [Cupriavidus plantarum]|uniref:LysR family transcriptional regulator n=1 Tax=Cupriavidus plantarum TaxID=942865 RepID=UPI000E265076|nr:LysR family transcriptional regulator [Cupriavidus plantarum]REE93778.1 DNA-binding transcriptional LysR family regulator [Cupriavidus plantarum]
MNLSAFNTLRAILVHGNFTAAGAAIGCTPSAVSLQIKQLEQYLGQQLFDRSTRIVRPTPFAMDVAAAAAAFSDRIESMRSLPSLKVEGRVRLGVITSMQSDLLPEAYKLLRQKHPALDVRIPPLNDTDELLAELRAGRIDAALLVRPENGGSSRMVWRDVWVQPFVMLAPPYAPDADARTLLNTFGWLAYDTSIAGGRVAARHVRALVPGISPTLELRSMDAIVSMVSAGMGVSVVPEPRRPLLDAYSVRTIELGRRAPSRRIALVWRSADLGDRRIEAVAQAFEQMRAAVTPAPRRPDAATRPRGRSG